MIRLLAPERWTATVGFGLVAAFALVGVIANAATGAARDAVLLALFAAWLVWLAALRWIRFVRVTADGLEFRNWLVVRQLSWDEVPGFVVRRAYHPRGGGWVVEARRARGGAVRLRATERGGRRPGSLGALLAEQICSSLEAARQTTSGR